MLRRPVEHAAIGGHPKGGAGYGVGHFPPEGALIINFRNSGCGFPDGYKAGVKIFCDSHRLFCILTGIGNSLVEMARLVAFSVPLEGVLDSRYST